MRHDGSRLGCVQVDGRNRAGVLLLLFSRRWIKVHSTSTRTWRRVLKGYGALRKEIWPDGIQPRAPLRILFGQSGNPVAAEESSWHFRRGNLGRRSPVNVIGFRRARHILVSNLTDETLLRRWRTHCSAPGGNWAPTAPRPVA